MKQFEYKILAVNIKDDLKFRDQEKLVDLMDVMKFSLNNLGKKGYKIASCQFIEKNKIMVCIMEKKKRVLNKDGLKNLFQKTMNKMRRPIK